MKYQKLFPVLVLFLIALLSCERTPPAPPIDVLHEVILEPQQERYELFTSLLASMDTASALDSVLAEFEQDPNVKWAVAGEQGIAVQYKNGIRGGIVINTLDYPQFTAEDLLKTAENLKNAGEFLSIEKTIPGSRKALFIAPTYTEFNVASEILTGIYNDLLPKVGYEYLVVVKDDEATLEKFTSLDEYGIIHISSHGIAWPKSDDISDIFLQTGQHYSDAFYEEYKEDIMNGDIGVLFFEDHNEVYINADFIHNYNNFKGTDPLIFGEFCFSSLGNWPKKMNRAGAGGYFGFDWAVSSKMSAFWNINLMDFLTNTDVVLANSAEDWMNTDLPKSYWAEEHNRDVSITYEGLSDLVLFDPAEIESTFTTCTLAFRVYANFVQDAYSYGNDTIYYRNTKLEKVAEFTGSFSGNTFTGSYDWYNEDIGLYEYDIIVSLNSDRDKIIGLTATFYQDEYAQNMQTGLEITATSIPIAGEVGLYEISNTETCGAIDFLDQNRDYDGRPLLDIYWTESLQQYSCNEYSYIEVTFE